MSTRKKIIIGLLISLIVIGVVVVILHFLKKKNASSKTIDVYPVSMLGQDGSWFGNDSTISGNVSVNMEQKIYPIKSQKIKEVFVKEGDMVKAGDVIIEYDTTAQSLSLQTKKTEVEIARTDVLVAERELEELYKIVPVEDMPQPEPEPTTEETTEENPISTSTDALPAETNTEAPVQENVNENQEEIPEDLSEEDFQITYTRDELNKAIKEKQNEIKSLNTKYQLEQVEYEIMEYQLSSGQVVANFDGVVKTAVDEETALADNTAMIVLSGTSGYTVKATIGEMSLNKVSLGDSVELYCYDTSMYYSGTVTEKTLIPSSSGGYYGGGVTQTYYPIVITIEDAEDLEQGMYMDITIHDNEEESDSSMYLPLAFVKRDNDNYYVMKEDKGKLKKVYVKTGKIMWGELIEVKSGVSMDDYLAFPYASNVEEGIKTKHNEDIESLYY